MFSFSKKHIATAVILATQSFSAHSLIVNLDNSTVSNAGPVTTTGTTDFNNNVSSSALSSTSAGSAFNRSIGRSNRSFYNQSNGSGDFNSSGIVTQTYTVTNDESFSQDLSFDFEVLNGSISSNCFVDNGSEEEGEGSDENEEISLVLPNPNFQSNEPCGANEYSLAGYSSSIFLNGDLIAWNEASLRTDSNGVTFGATSHDGQNLGTYTANTNIYAWGTQQFNLDLGTILSNETFTLEYRVETYTEGFIEGIFVNNFARAQFGDPSGFGATPTFSTNTPPTNIPEPSTIALFFGGLLSISVLQRRRRSL